MLYLSEHDTCFDRPVVSTISFASTIYTSYTLLTFTLYIYIQWLITFILDPPSRDDESEQSSMQLDSEDDSSLMEVDNHDDPSPMEVDNQDNSTVPVTLLAILCILLLARKMEASRPQWGLNSSHLKWWNQLAKQGSDLQHNTHT